MTKIKDFFKKHWIDMIVITVVIALLALLCASIYVQFNFEKKLNIFYKNFIDNEGYKEVLKGLGNTATIAVLGLIIGIVIGTFIAVIKVIPPYKRIVRYMQKAVSIYVAFFRGTPIVVQLLVGYFIIFPLLRMKIAPVDASVWIFGLNSGAYSSEIMRGGINSVDKGQLEAARAVGMPFSTSMLKIVVPQAVKNILPTLGNEFIALIKETSVVGYVGAVDVTMAFQYLGSSSYEYMIPYLVMALIYIILVAGISLIVKIIERKLAKSERQ